MMCDIIIPVWDQPELTKSCIEHLVRNTEHPYRLILVDNGSGPETAGYLKDFKNKYPETILIRNEENLGFVKAVNQGLKTSSAPYVCVLNNDTEPGTGWLSELVEFAEKDPGAGLLNPLCSGHAGRNLSVNEYAKLISSENKGKYMEMNQCQGFSMLIKRGLIDKIGMLDERFGMGGFDDTDYSMRAHLAGYRCVCVYSSYVYHKEHASFDRMGERKKLQADAEKEYFKKWPRHLRIASIFFLSGKKDEEIANFLRSSLFMARDWCWVNLWIFGDKNASKKIEDIKEKISFPLHQNLKFNYLRSSASLLEIAARILERSFGAKKRKKYDVVTYDNPKLKHALNMLCRIQGSMAEITDHKSYSKNVLKNIIEPLRGFYEENVKCDIILPVCDQHEFTKKCIESIIRNTDTPYRLIIINNGKSEQTRKLLDELDASDDAETTIVHNDHNIGWVKALNKGIELSSAPYICFQNDDTVVTRGWLKKMINTLRLREEYGMINPSWEGRPPSVSIDRYNAILEKRGKKFIETDWCRGFCAVIKRKVVERVGRVDEIYGLAYFDDVDYSVAAIEAGFLCLRALDAYVYHHRNITFFEVLKGPKWNELHEKNKLIYYKRWGRPLKIFLILDEAPFGDNADTENMINALYYLARKQHKLYIWCPQRSVHDRVRHTNVIFRDYPGIFLSKLANLDLFLNARKEKGKRYDAVFISDGSLAKRFSRRFSGFKIYSKSDKAGFSDFLKKTVDDLKEKTKEGINA